MAHNEKLIRAAVAVAQRGGLLQATDEGLLLAGARALEGRGRPYTQPERRVLDLAASVRRRPCPLLRFEAATPELDAEIERVERALQEATERLDSAQAAWEVTCAEQEARLREAKVQAAAVGPDEAYGIIVGAESRGQTAVSAAKAERQKMEAGWLLLRGRLTSLLLIRDQERARRSTTYHHNG